MPVYEYRCETCGENFELFVRSTTRQGKPECPRCGSTDVKKAVSLFGVGGTGSRAESAACGPGPV